MTAGMMPANRTQEACAPHKKAKKKLGLIQTHQAELLYSTRLLLQAVL
jgi:hypothetical protein